MYSEWDNLLEGAKGGSESSKEEILKRLFPLIIKSIKHYYNRRHLYEELIQEGNLCILECIESFNPQKKVYFLGYVKTQLMYLYINKNRERVHLSLNRKVGDEEQDEIIDLIASDEEEVLESIIQEETTKDTIKDLARALSCLTDRQKEIVILFYIKRMSIQEIANSLGVKYRTIVNTKTRAIVKLRDNMGI